MRISETAFASTSTVLSIYHKREPWPHQCFVISNSVKQFCCKSILQITHVIFISFISLLKLSIAESRFDSQPVHDNCLFSLPLNPSPTFTIFIGAQGSWVQFLIYRDYYLHHPHHISGVHTLYPPQPSDPGFNSWPVLIIFFSYCHPDPHHVPGEHPLYPPESHDREFNTWLIQLTFLLPA